MVRQSEDSVLNARGGSTHAVRVGAIDVISCPFPHPHACKSNGSSPIEMRENVAVADAGKSEFEAQ